MKRILLIVLSFMATSCLFSDYLSELIISPTNNYSIQASVNQTDNTKENYALVIIYLFNKENEIIDELNSGVGDVNKWAIGWTKIGDTIVLQSFDIGNQAWEIKNNSFTKIQIDDKLNSRAEELYYLKYK